MFFGFPLLENPSNMHYILDAFMHWTYQHSKGHRFVTDFRGFGSVLTNPQIHDVNPANVWGCRNGRTSAVALMITQHRCKLGCQLLGLPPLVKIPVQLPSNDQVWCHAMESTTTPGEKTAGGLADLNTFLATIARPAPPKAPTPTPEYTFF
ncbi:uncharacterized protein MELLADRAFT_73761 [Melampsora larici-populina 98AG31]|uniref:Alpha-type protein kinase domain-containing protein n=1 Tax=Melampsora larici-populina (strain 98AG31 / pathotype 3-4-7) TaxID=747676 RepID=F4SEH6_MELLP|nr:uncharacterized protein MELLADRAFT_73761 [Melampsora larici-populina 98AG31]EGF96951.1 hypothetical protein MELLADRAFT_73761 [Melampsora larici-populina 98AG31]